MYYNLHFPPKPNLFIAYNLINPHYFISTPKFNGTTIHTNEHSVDRPFDTNMRDSATQEVPSPWVLSEQLSAHIKKCVMFAGKVQNVDSNFVMLDAGDNSRPVKVQRAVPSMVQLEPGMTILIRGFVNDDLSISETASFPPTVLSDNFGTS